MALPATRTAPWQRTATEQHPTTTLEHPTPPKTTNSSDNWATTQPPSQDKPLRQSVNEDTIRERDLMGGADTLKTKLVDIVTPTGHAPQCTQK